MGYTFDDIWNTIEQTPYEKINNISVISKDIIVDKGDIKLCRVLKSTGEYGLIIFFKGSKSKEDSWFRWYPSSNQQKELPLIADIILNIDDYNSQFWSKNGSS